MIHNMPKVTKPLSVQVKNRTQSPHIYQLDCAAMKI